MMFVILKSEDSTKTLYVIIFFVFFYDFVKIIKEKSQSKSQSKVERFS